MSIDWIYDTTYVSFGVEWNAAYKAVGKVTIQPVVYRWDRYDTADSSKFSETLRYEPNGATGSWSNIGWGSGSGTRSIDPFAQRTYARKAAAYTVQLEIATDSGFGTAYDGYFHTIGAVTRTATYTVPALPPAFNTLSATRVSDNQVNLSWTAASGNIKAVCIERSVDGGSFSEVAVIWNASATSWQDNTTTADHSYTYRARYHHEGSYGAYSNTATVTMTPSAPQAITTAAAGGINIDVTLTNPSPVATKVQYQVSTDGGANWGATQDSASLTSFSVSASGTVKIRVRNYNATGTSDWLTSDTIVTICPPAAPTLKSPSGVFSTAEGDIVFEWQFNTIDGSKQTAYKLSWDNDDGTVTGTTGKVSSSDNTYSMQNPFNVGDEVNWSLQTWGAATTGGYDGEGSSDPEWIDFYVYSPPTLSITSPGATITGMPIVLTATYSDMAGFTCQAATVSLTKDGRTLYSEAATVNGTSITSSLDVSEFLPTNGETYTVVLTARSSSSLQTTANATFTVDFMEPQAGDLNISNDPDTGYVSLLATFDNSASEITYTGDTNTQYESTEGYVRSLTVDGKSEVQSGSLVSIEGVEVRGRNLANLEGMAVVSSGVTYTTDGSTITLSGTSGGSEWSTSSSSAYIPVEPNTAYTISLSDKPNDLFDGFYISFWEVDENKANVMETLFAAWSTQHDVTEKTMTTRSNTRYLKVRCGARYANTATNVTVDVMLELGSTAHAYEPYSLTTITTPLRSAGTVHDQLQAGKDSWTVERKVGYVDLGTLTWTVRNGVGMQTGGLSSLIKSPSANDQLPNVMMPNATPMTWTVLVNSGTSSGGVGVSGGYLAISTTATDPAAFKTAMSGVYLFYELATPTQDADTSMTTIEIGSAFTVATDLDSTFAMTTWDGSADAVSISVSRVNADETLTPLITDGASGSGVVDRYAPLNTPYQYAVTTKASSQAVKTVYVDNELVTDLWFAYWTHRDGETVTEMTASAKWNPDNGGIQVTRPQKTRVYYAGRRDPVSYDGHAVALTETPSWMFIEKSEVDAFVKLIEDGGRGVYKSCDGWVYHADFDLTLNPSYTAIGYYGKATLTVTRIAGERL